MNLFRNNFAGHFVSIAARPLNFDGRGQAQCILDGVLGLDILFIKLDPVVIPVKGVVLIAVINSAIVALI